MDAELHLLDLPADLHSDLPSDLDVSLPDDLDTDAEVSVSGDLHTKLNTTLPEDGKDYLAQLGLEHHDIVIGDHDASHPGKYYDDVPLEQNPEAHFAILADVLTRESIRRRSRKTGNDPLVDLDDVLTPADAVDSAGYEELDVSIQLAAAHSSAKQQSRVNGSSSTRIPGSPRRVSFQQDVAEVKELGRGQTLVEVEVHHPPQGHKHSSSRSRNGSHNGQRRRMARSRMALGQESTSSGVTTDYILHSCEQIQQELGQDGPKTSPQEIQQVPEINTSPSGKSRKFKFPSLERLRQRKGQQKGSEEFILAYEARGDYSSQVRWSGTASSQSEASSSNSPRYAQPPGQAQVPVATDARQETPNDRQTHSEKSFAYKILPTRKDLKSGSKSPRHGNAEKRLSSSREAKAKQSSMQNPAAHTNQRPVPLFEFVSVEQGVALSSVTQLHSTQTSGSFLVAAQGNAEDMKQALSGLPRDEVLRMRDEEGNNLLHLSASNGNMPCVEYLGGTFGELLSLDNKAKLTPVAAAIKHGQIDVLDWILEHCSSVDRQLLPPQPARRSLLHQAAKFGQDGCLRLLLSRLEASGRLTTVLDLSGNSPAHLAAKYGHLSCLQTLVEYGLDVSSENKHGHTPCFYADFNNQRASAGYLMVVETCAKLAQDLAISTHAGERLAEETRALQGCLSQTLPAIKDVAVVCKESQGSKEHLGSLLSDYNQLTERLTNQLQDLFSENCALRQRFNGTNGAKPGVAMFRQDIEESLATAHHVRSNHMNIHVPPHTDPRTHNAETLLAQTEHQLASLHHYREEDREEEVGLVAGKAIMRERLSDALQRLVVFRTSIKDVTHLRTSMASPDGSSGAGTSASIVSGSSTSSASREPQEPGLPGSTALQTIPQPDTLPGIAGAVQSVNKSVQSSQVVTLCSRCLQNPVQSDLIKSSNPSTPMISPVPSDSGHQFMASTPCPVYSNLPLPGSVISNPCNQSDCSPVIQTVLKSSHPEELKALQEIPDPSRPPDLQLSSDSKNATQKKPTLSVQYDLEISSEPSQEIQEAITGQVSHSDRDTSDSDSQRKVHPRHLGRVRHKQNKHTHHLSASVSDSALYVQQSDSFYAENQDNFSTSTPVIPKKLDISPKDFRETYQRPLVLKPRHDGLENLSLGETDKDTDGGNESDAVLSGQLSTSAASLHSNNSEDTSKQTHMVVSNGSTQVISAEIHPQAETSVKESSLSNVATSALWQANMTVPNPSLAESSTSSSQEDLIPCKMARGSPSEETGDHGINRGGGSVYSHRTISPGTGSGSDVQSDCNSPIPKPPKSRRPPVYKTVVVTGPTSLMGHSTQSQTIPKHFCQDYNRELPSSPGYILQPIEVSNREAAQPLHLARSTSGYPPSLPPDRHASLGGLMVTFKRPEHSKRPIVMGQDLLQSPPMLSFPTADDLPAMFTSDEEWGTDKSTTSMSDDEVLSPYEDDIIIGRQLIGGGLPRGLQFKRRLPTIEEVSVKSESTRADDDGKDDSEVEDTVTGSHIDMHSAGSYHVGHQRMLPQSQQDLGVGAGSQISQREGRGRSSKAWYEVSDDEDSVSWQQKRKAEQQADHFTLF